MSWQVDWLPDAEQELAAAWLVALDRDAITRAANYLDQMLAADPENVGESRPDNHRICFAPPLGAVYRVFPGGQRVEIAHVWRYQTH